MPKAIWNGVVLAESNQTVVVESIVNISRKAATTLPATGKG